MVGCGGGGELRDARTAGIALDDGSESGSVYVTKIAVPEGGTDTDDVAVVAGLPDTEELLLCAGVADSSLAIGSKQTTNWNQNFNKTRVYHTSIDNKVEQYWTMQKDYFVCWCTNVCVLCFDKAFCFSNCIMEG